MAAHMVHTMSAARSLFSPMLSKLNVFVGPSLRCAVSGGNLWQSQAGFYSGKSVDLNDQSKEEEEDERITVLSKIGFSREHATRYITELRPLLQNIQSKIDFFKLRDFKDSDIRKIIEKRHVMQYKTTRIALIEQFLYEELDCNAKQVRQIMINQPYLITCRLENLHYCLRVMPPFLGISLEAFKPLARKELRYLMSHPGIFEQLVELKEETSVSMKRFLKWTMNLHSSNSFSAEEGKRCAKLLKDFGFGDEDASALFETLYFPVQLNKETVRDNLNYLLNDLQLTRSEMIAFLCRRGDTIHTPTAELKWKIEYLMTEGGMSREEVIVSGNTYTRYSMKRLKARVQFARKCGQERTLRALISLSDASFVRLCGSTHAEYKKFKDSM